MQASWPKPFEIEWCYLIKTISKAYSVSDSISATPIMKVMRMAPPAPGFRAMPSQADAVAIPWPIPQAAAVIPRAIAAATVIQFVVLAAAPEVCANVTGASINIPITAKTNQAAFFTIFPLLYGRQEVVPVSLGRRAVSRCSGNDAGLVFFRDRHAQIHNRQNRENECL